MDDSINPDLMYKNSFTYDANGNILTQNRANGANTVLDDLTYHYETFPNGDPRNRLAYVSDASSNTDPLELSNQSAANYSYDKEGRLISDAQEEIGVISWRVDGKVKKISRISGSQKKNVSFDYDAMGHRIAKHVYSSNDIWENSTFYVLDAQGNTLSTYSYEKDDSTQSISFAQTEKLCYGSARLGLNNEKVPLLASQNGNYSMQYVSHTVGNRLYELSNHLGNVLSVVSDKVIPFPNQNMTPGSYFLFFIPDIRQSTDYSPFGVTLQGRNFTANGTEKLRYAFQGQERDDEIKGAGNSYNYEYRMHDPRLGRFFAIDPLAHKFPYYSPYHFSSNSPIMAVELEGLETSVQVNYTEKSILITRDDNNRLSVTNKQIEEIGGFNGGNVGPAFPGRLERNLEAGGYIDVDCSDCGVNSSGASVRIYFPKIQVTRYEEIEREVEITIPGVPATEAKYVFDDRSTTVLPEHKNGGSVTNQISTGNTFAKIRVDQAKANGKFTSLDFTAKVNDGTTKAILSDLQAAYGKSNVNFSVDPKLASDWTYQANYKVKRKISNGTPAVPERKETIKVKEQVPVTVDPVIVTP